MTQLPRLAAAFMMAAGLPAAVHAAPVTRGFFVTAGGFVDQVPSLFGGPASPVPRDPVSFDVLVTVDPATGDQFDQTAGISLLGGSVPVTSQLAFDYDSAADTLTVGGLDSGTDAVAGGTADILVSIGNAFLGAPSLLGVTYTGTENAGIFTTGSGSVDLPAPGIAGLALALAALGANRRRR